MSIGLRVASRLVVVAVCLASVIVAFPVPSQAEARLRSPSSCWVTQTRSGPQVHWRGVAGARGYYVFRDGARARRSSSNKRSAVDTRASAGTHRYRVAAFNQAGRGQQRDCGQGVAQRGPTKTAAKSQAGNNGLPPKPSYCNVTRQNGKPLLRWADASNVTFIIWRDGKRIDAAERPRYADTAARSGLRRYSVAAANAKGAGPRRYCGRITI